MKWKGWISTKKQRKRSPAKSRLFSFALFIIASFGIYLLSEDSRIVSLAVNGNHYYSKQQIFEIANVKASSRILLSPDFAIENGLSSDPFIEQADASYTGNRLSIDVKEKQLLGYYYQNSEPYIMTLQGESIPVDDDHLDLLNHLPLMAGFTNKQMSDMAEEFSKYPTLITADIIDQISEIVPWSESYDEDMYKITMQDGNVIISSINDLVMISKYPLVVPHLTEENVCLFLDREQSAIDKISCEYIYMSSEEREEQRRAIHEQVQAAAKAAKEQEEEQAKQEARANADTQTESDTQSQSSQSTEQTQQNQQSQQTEQAQPYQPEQPTESGQSDPLQQQDYQSSMQQVLDQISQYSQDYGQQDIYGQQSLYEQSAQGDMNGQSESAQDSSSPWAGYGTQGQ